MAATVKAHIYDIMVDGKAKKFVHAVYDEVVEKALTEPKSIDDVTSLIEVESGESVPSVEELRTLRTTCSKLPGEEKWVVRAVLRYIGA